MTLGEMIAKARKGKGWNLDELSERIGMSRSNLCILENDGHKKFPDPQTVIRIAEALECEGILFKYLETNPVFKAVIPRIFPELNRIRTEPAIVFSRFEHEAEEGASSARVLSQLFAHADPKSAPGYAETFAANMEQIIDVQRCAEILMTSLVAAGVMSEVELRELHERQQAKCEAKGHHILGEVQRTGTEG